MLFGSALTAGARRAEWSALAAYETGYGLGAVWIWQEPSVISAVHSEVMEVVWSTRHAAFLS